MTAVQSRQWRTLFLISLCAVVYFPALNNGFIADDYPYLQWATTIRTDFGFLFQIPPNTFRLTCMLVFGALKDLVGYRSEYFYVFAILVHFLNCWLLWKVVSLLGTRPPLGYLAAILFAVFHAPQEALLWLAGMSETLMAFCVLAAMLAWLQGRYVLCALIYLAGLFSKESAVILLLLLPLIQWQRKQSILPGAYFLLVPPTLVFAGVFLWTWSINSYIQQSVYSLGFHAVVVFFRTLNRLLWPWFYFLLAAYRIRIGRWPALSMAGTYLLWITIAMLPYLFLTYQSALPSRHLYLVSMVIATGMAFLLTSMPNQWFQRGFVLVFLVSSIGYLWIRKDGQFENRARPTNELVRLLRSHKPMRIFIYDFPYEQSVVAKSVSWAVPGWTPDLIGVDGTDQTCSDCVILRWNPQSRTYAGDW